MVSNIDDFPVSMLPPNEGKPADRKQAFTFGDEDDDDDLLETAEEQHEDDEELEELDGDEPLPIPLPASPVTAAPTSPPEPNLGEPLDKLQLLATVEHILEDPALQAITRINKERYLTKAPRPEESARVTRQWLMSLEQRDFFLAIAYPGTQLFRLLQAYTSLGQLRAWVDGLEAVPDLIRRVLMLEHLLDRRTLANRRRMPTRQQIEDAIRAMPRTGLVSEVLGGFDNIPAKDLERHPPSTQATPGTTQHVAQALRIVHPGEESRNVSPRKGAALPINARLRGKGRPLGQRLLKPDPYCYGISKKSRDAAGVPHISPQQAMEMVNKAADLENQYRVFYSIRRADPSKPWTVGNVEYIPTEEIERERQHSLRTGRGEE